MEEKKQRYGGTATERQVKYKCKANVFGALYNQNPCGIPVGDNKGCAKWWRMYIYLERFFFINERWKGSIVYVYT